MKAFLAHLFLAALLLISIGASGQAPTISYATPQVFTKNVTISTIYPTEPRVDGGAGYDSTYTIGTGYSRPYGVATDALGNVYIGDSGNNAVKKVPAGGGAPIAIGSGFNMPSGVAVDAAGNVYVADYGNNAIKKIPAGGGAVVTLGSGFNGPIAVAVDASGNLYVADKGNNAVKEIPAGNGTPVTLSATFSGPSGVAVDGSGNVYVADSGNGAIKEIYKAGGGVGTLVAAQTNPQGVAVDAAGMVYFSTAVAEGISSYDPFTQTSSSLELIGTGITSPANLFVDGTGKIAIADQGGNQIEQVIPGNGAFINKPLPAGLVFDEIGYDSPYFYVAPGNISGTPTMASAATNYVVTLYQNRLSASTTINIAVLTVPPPVVTYTSPQTFYQGILVNAVPATSNTAAASSGPNSTLLANANAYGITRDASNNLYFTNPVSNSVSKLAPGGITIAIASGFNEPEGIAIDPSGNIYVADAGDNSVKKISAGGGPPVTIASGLTTPTDVTIDASGNIFVAVWGAGAVEELPVGGGTPFTVGSGFTHPYSLKFDKAGNLFIADGVRIYEIPSGSSTRISTSYSAASTDIEYIAIDASDNIFYTTSSDVYMVPVGGGSPYLIAGASSCADLTIDDSDNIYFCASSIMQTRLLGGYFIAPKLPAGLSLNQNTGAITGTPTQITPAANYTVQAFNPDTNSTTLVNIHIGAPPPPTISYASPQILYYGNVITPIQPTSTNVGLISYGLQPAIVGSGFKNPRDEVVDAAGNIYVADQGNSAIKKIPAGGGTPITICSGSPIGMAIDVAGNIFFSEASAIYKVAAGSSTAVIFASGLSSAKGIATDAAGDVYVAEEGKNDVKKIPAAGGAPVVVATGVSVPTDVALDSSGNLYITDNTNDPTIIKIPASGGAALTIAALNFPPASLAVDDVGNIYADGDVNGNYEIALMPVGGQVMYISAALNNPMGLALDKSHNLYVADDGNSEVKKISVVGGYFITPVLPLGLAFNSSTGTISGTPPIASPATNYTITGVNYSGSASTILSLTVTVPPAPTLSYATPQNYIIGATITPLMPAATNVYPLSYNLTVSTSGSGLNLPTGVAHDGSGNLYVADNGNNAVKKIPAGGGTPVVIGSGFSNPTGIALDGSGNIYVADRGNNAIKEIPSGSNTPVIIGSGFSAPTGVAADLSGNIYVVDGGNHAVKEIPAGSNIPVTLSSSFSNPYNIAIDGAGNIYVADAGSNAVYMLAPGSSIPTLLYSSAGVYGVAVGTSGILYYNSTSTNTVTMVPPGGSPTVIASGFNTPVGMSVDGSGNLYVADEGNNIIKIMKPNGGYFVSPWLPVGLSLNTSTGIISGTPIVTRKAENYNVTGYNITGSKRATVNITVGANDRLANLAVNTGTLSPAFSPGTFSYSDAAGSAASIKVTPTTSDPLATVAVNGTAVASGTASGPITLSPGTNTITVVVTASDGVTKQTYTITVGQGSNDAYLASLHVVGQTISPSFAFQTLNYTCSVPNATSSVSVSALVLEAHATFKVNGTPLANQTDSPPIALAVGPNVIDIVVTAQDGVTMQTYTVTVTRAAAPIAHVADAYQAISVSNPDNNPSIIGEDIKVHQGISPNGDGIDDVFTIDNIANYPQNKLMIMDRNGVLIYQANGYDNVTKAFDGHSNINGRMQLPGTYFYALDYTMNGITKRKTGFIVLKY